MCRCVKYTKEERSEEGGPRERGEGGRKGSRESEWVSERGERERGIWITLA